MRYYTTSALSPHILETPEHYLLCLDVPVARTGVQEYLSEEVPGVEPGASGMVLMRREEAEVFAPATIASFEGKSVTLEHPDPDADPDVPDVNPDNWRELTVGVAMHVRRGSGDEADLLLADLLITDAEAIEAVREKRLREVSCGYSADYEAIRPGVGRQTNIIGNHVALVPHGRAGGRVAIKDATKEKSMKVKKGFWDRFTAYLKKGKTVDEAAEAAARDEEQSAPAEPKKEEQPAPATDGDDALAQLSAKVDELALMVRALVEGRNTGDADPEACDEEPNKAADEDPEKAADEEPEADPKAAKTGDARAKAADAALCRRVSAHLIWGLLVDSQPSPHYD
jgi:hypothetical protein